MFSSRRQCFPVEGGTPEGVEHEAEMNAVLGGVPRIGRDLGAGRLPGGRVQQCVELRGDMIEAGVGVLGPERGTCPGRQRGVLAQDFRDGGIGQLQPVEACKVFRVLRYAIDDKREVAFIETGGGFDGSQFVGHADAGLLAVGGEAGGAVDEQRALGDFGDEGVEFGVHGDGETGVFVRGRRGFVLDDVVDVVGKSPGTEVVERGRHAAVTSVDGVDFAGSNPVGPQRRGRGIAEHEAADGLEQQCLTRVRLPVKNAEARHLDGVESLERQAPANRRNEWRKK